MSDADDVAPDFLRHGPTGCNPKSAMVLGAGLGMRLRPITDSVPKPLIEVCGRTLLDRVIDRLEEEGVERIVVNAHHLAPLIEEHLAKRQGPEIRISFEPDLLETGGGIAKALPLLGDGPFFAANGDILWLNGPMRALGCLKAAWDDGAMDGLLLLHSTVEAYGYSGAGDFWADPSGRLTRRPEREVMPNLFTGVQILHPRLFKDAPDGPFSMNVLYDKAMEAGRLFGVVHDGEWFHIGTAEGLDEAETFLGARYSGIRHR